MRENIVVLDFGGQYNQLIARRVRECNVYCEVHPYTISMDELKALAPSGIILTGGPNSVYGEDSPQCNPEVFKLGIPVLGICYGAQLLAHQLGGKVATAPVSEYGRTEVTVDDRSGLLFRPAPPDSDDVRPETCLRQNPADRIQRCGVLGRSVRSAFSERVSRRLLSSVPLHGRAESIKRLRYPQFYQ